MIRIGILGSIGSGKSYVAYNLGYPVFDADYEVAKLYKKNKTNNCCSNFIWSNYTKGIFGPFQKWFFKYSCIHLAQI